MHAKRHPSSHPITADSSWTADAPAVLLATAVWIGIALLVLTGAADSTPALFLASLPVAA